MTQSAPCINVHNKGAPTAPVNDPRAKPKHSLPDAIEKPFMSNEESSINAEPGGSAEQPEQADRRKPVGQDAVPSDAVEQPKPAEASRSGVTTHALMLPEDDGDQDTAGAALASASMAKALASGSADLEGAILSERYKVGQCLGVGGMGTVWRAEHILMKKAVAIKVLHHDVVGRGEAVERFRREAQAAAHIDHPNVCVATDFGQMGQRGFFLVMEYLEGRTLDEALVEADRFAPDRAIHIADQILAALEQAHQFGVVHRDLKPENIMLIERDGDPDYVKIMDFGIARVPMADEQDDARLTRVGRVYGTPMYMSPEQASGETTGVGARSDLYTVGVMLFEMLSGTLPFIDKSSAKLMAMHMTEPVPSVRHRVPEARLPKSLDRLVRRLMAKVPDERPASATEVRAELARIKQGGNTQSWVSVARDTLDASNLAIRRAAQPLRPHLRRARAWGKENPLAQKLILGALLFVLIGVPMITVAVLISSNPAGEEMSAQSREEQADSLAAERHLYIDKIEASSVINALAMGDADAALAELNALTAEYGDDAHLQFLRARASMMDENSQAALSAYQQALALDPRYASVQRVVDDVLEQFRSGEQDSHELAEDILLHSMPRAETNLYLSEIARMGRGSSLRRRAKSALEKDGRIEELEAWNQASIELRFAQGCTAHRDAIKKIVAAGDSRGLEVLHYYDERPRTGCGRLKREDCFGCIRKDLTEAIEALPVPDLTFADSADEVPASINSP